MRGENPEPMPDKANMGQCLSIATINGQRLNAVNISHDAAVKYLEDTGQ